MSDTVNACLLDGKGAASNIAISSIDCGAATDGVLWLHLDINDPQHVNWLKQSSKIDPLILDALLAEETRPRTTTIGDGLLMALRGVNLTPGPNPMIWYRYASGSHRDASSARAGATCFPYQTSWNAWKQAMGL